MHIFAKKKLGETEIVDFAKTQLTLPDKIDPSDAMSWQHHLYSKLGSKKPGTEETDLNVKSSSVNMTKQQILDELVDRIVAMAKVLFGLHMVSAWKFEVTKVDIFVAGSTQLSNLSDLTSNLCFSTFFDFARAASNLFCLYTNSHFNSNQIDHPQQQQKGAYRSVVSSQRKKAVIACFRQTSLHSMPRYFCGA
jgi:hypothetical protein